MTCKFPTEYTEFTQYHVLACLLLNKACCCGLWKQVTEFWLFFTLKSQNSHLKVPRHGSEFFSNQTCSFGRPPLPSIWGESHRHLFVWGYPACLRVRKLYRMSLSLIQRLRLEAILEDCSDQLDILGHSLTLRLSREQGPTSAKASYRFTRCSRFTEHLPASWSS